MCLQRIKYGLPYSRNAYKSFQTNGLTYSSCATFCLIRIRMLKNIQLIILNSLPSTLFKKQPNMDFFLGFIFLYL